MNYFKKVVLIIVFVIVAWVSCGSVAYVEKPVVTPEPTVECIDRRTVKIEYEDTVIRKDGSINYLKLKDEANWISKVIFGTARHNSDSQKETVVWCVLNRVESKEYPNNIKDVCQQKMQFKGFSVENKVEDDTFEIVYSVLMRYYLENYRPCSNKLVYMSTSGIDVCLRDTFDLYEWTHYWRA